MRRCDGPLKDVKFDQKDPSVLLDTMIHYDYNQKHTP